jgi:hypothetical protein
MAFCGFKRLYGVKPDTFHQMLLILQKEFDAMRKNDGKPPNVHRIKILAGIPDDGKYRGGIRGL